MPAGSLVAGLVCAPGVSRGLADELAERLPDELRSRLGDTDWRVEVAVVGTAEPTAHSDQLVDTVRRVMLEHDWNVAVGLTELPLIVDRRPVDAHTDPTHGVAVLSVPALGPVRMASRLVRTVARLIETLVGDDNSGWRRGLTLATKARLVAGMVRLNQPALVVSRLSRSVVGALGTGAFALASQNIWALSAAMSWLRLLAVTAFTTAVMSVALVVAHELWERAEHPDARERARLFNVVTLTTLAIGVFACFAVLFAISLVAAGIFIPPKLFARETSHPADIGDYLRLAWVIATIATAGGALGSLVESDEDVRAAAYRRDGAAADPAE